MPEAGRHLVRGGSDARPLPAPGGEQSPRSSGPPVDLAQVIEDEAVLPRNRMAIAAYLAHQPSPLERLGVELAGVDERVCRHPSLHLAGHNHSGDLFMNTIDK